MSYKIIINELKNKIENLKSELAESKKLIEKLKFGGVKIITIFVGNN